MTALLYLLGIVAFAVLLLASIGLHELGHMVPAKRFGARVPQWFIGFGPTVWSLRRGKGSRETEYGVKAIPLGGFVKIVGMLPPDRDGRLRGSSTGFFSTLISDARAAESQLVTAEDERDGRLFYRLTWWKKVVVMSGGPVVNLLIAFVLLLLIFSAYGVRDYEPKAGAPVVSSVSQCVIPYAESGRACRAGDPVAPAYEAGLRPGDTITSFNGTAITGWDQLTTLIRSNAAGTAVIGYERDGVARTGTTSTTVEARPSADSSTDDTGSAPKLHQVGFLGVSPTVGLVVTHHGPLYTVQQMGHMIGQSVGALVHLPVRVWGVAKAIVGAQPRAADSPISIVGGGRIAGESLSSNQFDLAEKLVSLLSLVAGFNLFLGIFNFVPLLPLDGGHVAGALWEAVRRGLARVLRRPDPGFVDVAKLLPIAYVVGAAMLVMGMVLIIGDIVVPVQSPLG